MTGLGFLKLIWFAKLLRFYWSSVNWKQTQLDITKVNKWMFRHCLYLCLGKIDNSVKLKLKGWRWCWPKTWSMGDFKMAYCENKIHWHWFILTSTKDHQNLNEWIWIWCRPAHITSLGCKSDLHQLKLCIVNSELSFCSPFFWNGPAGRGKHAACFYFHLPLFIQLRCFGKQAPGVGKHTV